MLEDRKPVNVKKTQTAQANIFQGKIRTLIFTLPPLQEQAEIVSQIEGQLSTINVVEKEVEKNLIRVVRLRQSILKKAFTGELVPQNNNDESIENSLKKSA
jgi:type I restriction enzyme S subunit